MKNEKDVESERSPLIGTHISLSGKFTHHILTTVPLDEQMLQKSMEST